MFKSLALKTKYKYNKKEGIYISADNGIYILKTKEGQYRVIHAQAIENLYDINDFNILVSKQILEYYGESKYTYNKNVVRDIAFNMARNAGYLEYGVQEIIVDKTWNEILKEARKEKGERI